MAVFHDVLTVQHQVKQTAFSTMSWRLTATNYVTDPFLSRRARTIRESYARLQQAQTPLERRQAIQILRNGFFDAGLGDE